MSVRRFVVVAGLLLSCRNILPAVSNTAQDQNADFVDATLNPDVVVASQALNDQVEVQPDRLVFPASQEEEIRKQWPAGAPVVGGRRNGSAGNNAFGFIRRVVSIERQGETVVVNTERASIADVIVGKANLSTTAELGTLVDTTGIDVDAFFPPYDVGEGVPFGEMTAPARESRPLLIAPSTTQPITLAPNVDPFHLKAELELIRVGVTKRAGKIDVSLNGGLLVGGELTFKPRFRVEVDIGWTGLNFFEVEVGGDTTLKAWIQAAIEAKISAGSNSSDGVSLYETLKNMPTKPNGQVVLGTAGPFVGPNILGVQTTFRVSLIGDCSAKLYAGVTTRAEGTISDQNMKIGFRYDGKSHLTGSQNFSTGGKVTITAAGGAEIECGVSPRVSWLVADEAGPYLQVRSSMRAEAAYKESCDPKAKKSGRPDASVEFALTPVVKLQTGGEVHAFKVVDFEVGPLTLLNYEFPPVWQRVYGPWLGRGIGYCVADCQNGTRSGNESDVDCGGSCLACASGKHCTVDSECKSGLCGEGICAATACDDKVKDKGETDVDCGGGCAACATGKGCAFDADCASGFCSSATKLCVATSCTDAHLDGTETDVDCGGTCATKCLNQKKCFNGADCDSGSCDDRTGLCIGDSCSDSVQGQRETDVDCGGSFCPNRCAVTKKCTQHSDCQSNACNASTKRCVATQCEDAIKDNAETDVDCAGACSVKCATGKKCQFGSDCVSGNCNQSTHVCVALGCQDGVLSAGETGVDCGGVCPYQCQLGKGCATNSDCASGACGGGGTTKVCVAGACANGVQDGSETDVDCGPGCVKKCGFNKHCGAPSDCVSQICTAGVCQASGCFDKIKNGAETDTDCGGSCALKCALTQGCQADADCKSAICNQVTHQCVATRCEDGAKTSPNETDVDCGGTCPAKCGAHKGCLVAGDCSSTLCNQVQHWCAIDQCDDATKQGNETDVDCGGFCAPVNKGTPPNAQCRGGKGCAAATDCVTAVCQPDNKCQLGQCENLTKDGSGGNAESDIDCGGLLCGATCTPSQHCGVDADCASGFCNAVTTFCAASHCSDGRQDVGESGVDCGQACSGCPAGQGCNSNLDCASGFCDQVSTHQCQATSCTDRVADNGETDIDCGGTCGATCDGGQLCNSNADCLHGCDTLSGVCLYGTPHSCKQLLDQTPGLPDGVYTIAVFDTDRFFPAPGRFRDRNIYCDMTTAGGGWTLAWLVAPNGTPFTTNYYGFNFGSRYTDDDLHYAPFLGALGHHPALASSDDWPTVTSTYEAPLYLSATLDLAKDWNAPFWHEFRMSSYAHYGSPNYAQYDGPIIPKSALKFPFGSARGFIMAPAGGGFGNYMCFGPDQGAPCNNCPPWAGDPDPTVPTVCTGVGGRDVNFGYLYYDPTNSSVEMDGYPTDLTNTFTEFTNPACHGFPNCYIGPEGLNGPNNEFVQYESSTASGAKNVQPGVSQALWVR